MSGTGCTVASGLWHDPFTGQTFTDPADLQLDHVVALGDAWSSGAWSWTDGQRRAFSNNPANLNVIHGPENQTKADNGPSGYTPANPAHTCDYLMQYGSVKAAWSLTISRADFDAISTGLAGCSGAGGGSATTTTMPAGGCHPAYVPCLPNLAGDALNCGDLPSSDKPVQVLVPGIDPYRLDGDTDGIGCEAG